MGATSNAFAAVRHVIETAVRDGVVPGAVILCADRAVTRFHDAFGACDLDPQRTDATRDSVYDIASLTKAVSTSVLMMKAVGSRWLTLDDPVWRHLPEFRGPGKEAVTVRHLLCHASGLPAHRPFYEYHLDGGVVQAAASEPLINVPGAVSVYSDLGFILLGSILERLTGRSLNALFQEFVCDPLGLTSIRFVNLHEEGARHRFVADAPVAPTENCPVRGRILKGEVDDLNAFAMGGVAGHAGLFSDAAALGRIAAALVNVWNGGATSATHDADAVPITNSPGLSHGRRGLGVSREVVREFWRPAEIASSTWRLGWDGPAEHGSQAGDVISRAAVGHLGFTGCSLWIDPARALWIVLLTNRVHPTARKDPRFALFRAAVQDAVMMALPR